MRRRALINAIPAVLVAWSLPARAQQSRALRVGILLVDDPEPMGSFREALRQLGYIEDSNVQLEMLSAKGELADLPALAAEFVRRPVDVIVAVQTPAVKAAKNATSKIPIVMMAGDPIATGLVSNLARPDGNVTGLSAAAAESAAKSLELLLEIVPDARRLGVLCNGNDPFMEPFLRQIRQGAKEVHLELEQVVVSAPEELEKSFAAIARERADAVVIQGSLPVKPSVELSMTHRIPSLTTQKSAVKAGLLMSYTSSFSERGNLLAGYVDRLLKGARPSELPVQQPTRYEIAVNLSTARALGLSVPPSLLYRADELFE
jgi:putative tryptophan/tyrosine transport system substrate-binding protein